MWILSGVTVFCPLHPFGAIFLGDLGLGHQELSQRMRKQHLLRI
jgi:hypothetical protein